MLAQMGCCFSSEYDEEPGPSSEEKRARALAAAEARQHEHDTRGGLKSKTAARLREEKALKPTFANDSRNDNARDWLS